MEDVSKDVYKRQERFCEECKVETDSNIDEVRKVTDMMGQFIDCDHPYVTCSNDYCTPKYKKKQVKKDPYLGSNSNNSISSTTEMCIRDRYIRIINWYYRRPTRFSSLLKHLP